MIAPEDDDRGILGSVHRDCLGKVTRLVGVDALGLLHKDTDVISGQVSSGRPVLDRCSYTYTMLVSKKVLCE